MPNEQFCMGVMMLLVALFLASVLSGSWARPEPSYGPGRGSWVLERPEPFGIASSTLDLIAERVRVSMPERYCLLMSVDGHLIQETYFRNRSETRYEADSLAKTMTAQIVGVAVSRGLIDLDKPLAEYGVQPRCADGIQREKEMDQRYGRPNVTCNNLLRQLCPAYAPPWDASGRRQCHVCKNPVGGYAGRQACSMGCARDEKVRQALQEANCSWTTAHRWCSAPNGNHGGAGCWIDAVTGENYWPQVTARHLLTQTTGVGNYVPGSQFTYDSDQYIDHLAYLVSKVTNESSLSWATREYALPMGLAPDIFAYGGFNDPIDGPEFSPGGGQMMSCRDQMRVAQLLINKGRWYADDEGDGENGANHQGGKQRRVVQLLTEGFVREFLTPSFPTVSQSYGFLIWLNRPVNADGCCSPRWGGDARGTVGNKSVRFMTCSQKITPGGKMIGDGMQQVPWEPTWKGGEEAPSDLALGMGMSAK